MKIDPGQFGKMSHSCHMCKKKELKLVLDLGMQPHSDDFLTEERLDEMEVYFPLKLMSCGYCGLLQINYFVNPDILYRTNYIYESSITKSGVEHYKKMAAAIAKRFSFSKASLAVDIGSNVGVLLTGFKECGFDVLGVDPAEKVAQKAIDSGIDTVIDFFTETLADSIVKRGRKAQVITGTNVFAHLHEIDSAVYGMKKLLSDDGVIVIEAPYAVDMLKNVEYDTIYHQHIGYLSVKPLAVYFESFGLELFDVEKQKIHGGTLRYYIGHKGAYSVEEGVQKLIKQEEDLGLYGGEILKDFRKKTYQQRSDLLILLNKLKMDGKSIVGVSAPAKGNTLLNFCNIDNYYLDFLTEKSILKQNLFTPGTRIPIYSDESLLKEKPDYAIILAWNFAEEIIKNLEEYREAGGKFIVPIPEPTIIE
ncbi:MAG: class I SAM-dependent methyltransferase [Patescibacteria group bacterium UBA2163]